MLLNIMKNQKARNTHGSDRPKGGKGNQFKSVVKEIHTTNFHVHIGLQ